LPALHIAVDHIERAGSIERLEKVFQHIGYEVISHGFLKQPSEM
jgi:hypothetical protein